jgi:hypothetical protein
MKQTYFQCAATAQPTGTSVSFNNSGAGGGNLTTPIVPLAGSAGYVFQRVVPSPETFIIK